MLQTQNKDFVYEGEGVTSDGTIGPNTKHPATGEPIGDAWVQLATLVRFNIHRGMSAEEAFEAAVSEGGEKEGEDASQEGEVAEDGQ